MREDHVPDHNNSFYPVLIALNSLPPEFELQDVLLTEVSDALQHLEPGIPPQVDLLVVSVSVQPDEPLLVNVHRQLPGR